MSKYLLKHIYVSKIISILIAAVFFCQNFTYASSSLSSRIIANVLESEKDIFIPEQYGKIENSVNYKQYTVNSSQGRPLVVLVKDAHCHYEAQKNIARVLDILVKDYEIKLIGVEGAAGFVDPSVISGSPDNNRRKEIADKYLKKGYLTASEALAMEKGKDCGFKIWGIEDIKLYLNDLQAFRDVYTTNKIAQEFVVTANGIILTLKSKLYPKALLDYDKKVQDYRSNKLPLTDFVNYLYELDKFEFVKYADLKTVLKAINLERSIDFNEVEKERTHLIKECEKTLPKEEIQQLVQKSLLFKLGKISGLEYYTYLKQYTALFKNPKTIANLTRYTKNLKLHSKISSEGLFRDLDMLIEKVYANNVNDEIVRKLHVTDEYICYFNKLLKLEIARNDFDKCKELSMSPSLVSEFLKIQCGANGISIPPLFQDSGDNTEIESFCKSPYEFYKYALERDSAIVENLTVKMNKENKDKAVLVIGGFHADGVEKLLKEKNIETITIVPSITKEDTEAKKIYLSRMMDKRVDPEQILNELGMSNLSAPVLTGWKEIFMPVINAIQGELKGKVEKILAKAESKEVFKEEIAKEIDEIKGKGGISEYDRITIGILEKLLNLDESSASVVKSPKEDKGTATRSREESKRRGKILRTWKESFRKRIAKSASRFFWSTEPKERMIQMMTRKGRLAHSTEVIAGAVGEFGEDAVVYDIGIGWDSRDGPITTKELAEALDGKARVIGIDKQIPAYVLYTPQCTVLFDENDNLLSMQKETLFMSEISTFPWYDKRLARQMTKLAKRLRQKAGDEKEYTEGEYRIEFNPILRHKRENLNFVKANLFKLENERDLPKAHIVRITNVLMPHYTPDDVKTTLNSLLPFVHDGGYVYIGFSSFGCEVEGEEYLVYRKKGNRLVLESYALSPSVFKDGFMFTVFGVINETKMTHTSKIKAALQDLTIAGWPKRKEYVDFLDSNAKNINDDPEIRERLYTYFNEMMHFIVEEISSEDIGIAARQAASMLIIDVEDPEETQSDMKRLFMEAIKREFIDKGVPKEVTSVNVSGMPVATSLAMPTPTSVGAGVGLLALTLTESEPADGGLMGKYRIGETGARKEGDRIIIPVSDIENPEEGTVEVSLPFQNTDKAKVIETLSVLKGKNTIFDRAIDWFSDFQGDLVLLRGGEDKGILGVGTQRLIGVHMGLSDDPIAWLHEIVHAAMSSGVITLLEIEAVVKEDQWYKQHMAKPGRETLKEHYLIRALQRRIFSGLDKCLTDKIKRYSLRRQAVTLFLQESPALDRAKGDAEIEDRQSGRKIKVFLNGDLNPRFVDYIFRMEIADAEYFMPEDLGAKEEEMRGTRFYLITDTNGNKFIIQETDGRIINVSVKADPSEDSKGFFIFVSYPNVLASLDSKWQNTPVNKDKKSTAGYLYTASYDIKNLRHMLEQMSDNPILRHIFTMVMSQFSGLRLNGGMYLTDKRDAGGNYVPALNLILWLGLGTPSNELLGHETVHHIFESMPELYEICNDYFKGKHMRFLKWLKMHPLYGGRYRSKEFRDKSIEFFWAIDCNSAINETLAYLVDSIIGEETSLCGTRDNIKIGDIKFLVSNGLLPGDYFSSDILDKYTDEDLVTKGFYKTLKILYESRFNDDGKPILVRMQGIIESESRKDNPDIGLLYAIADYCLRAEEYETAKDLFVKIQAMQNKDKGTQTVCLVKLTEVNKKQKDAQSSQISESEREEIRQVLERMLENRSIMQDFIDASRHYGLLAQNVREVILWLDKDKKLENLLLLEIAHRKKKIKDFEARYVFKPYAPNKELLQEYEDLLYLYKILGMDSEAEGCEKKIEEILDEMLREEDMWRQVAKDEEKRRREQELMMRNIGNWSKFDWRSINRMQNFGDMDWRKMIDASVIFPDIHKIEPFKPIFVIKDSVIGRLTRLIEELAEGYENKYRSKIDDEKIARQIEAEGIIYNEYIIKRVYKSHSIVLLYLKTLWELIRQLVSRNISIRDAWKTFKDMNKIMKGYFSKNKKESNEKKKPSGGARKRVGDYDTDVKMTREEERYLDDLVSEEPAELRRSYEGISYKCIYYARSSELGRFLESKGVEGAYNFKGYILVEVGEEQARNWYYYGRTIKLTGEQNDALRHEELELFWGSHTLAWTYQIWEAFQNKKEDSKDMTIERLQIFVESQIDQMSYSDLIRFIEDTRERQHNIIRHAIRKYRFPQALSAVSQFELSAKEYAGRRLRLYIHRDVKRLERLLNEEWKRYETQLEESREIEEWFSVLRGNVGSLKFSIERMPEIIAPEGIGSVLRVTKLISRQSEHISKLRELLNNEIRGKYLASTVVFESEAEAFSKEYGELYDILTAIYNSPEEVFNEAQAIYVKVSEALAIINQDTRSNTRYKINQIRDLRKELSKALISIIGEKLNLMEKEIIDICSRANIFRQAYGNDEGVRYMLDIISASVYSIREKSVKVSSAYNYSEVDDVLRLLQLLYNCKVSIISLRNHIDGQSMDEFTRKYKGKNYYKVLGVPKGAGQDVIKGAFRQLALRYHPDRNPGNKEAEERFKEATEAYKALTEQREEYDILLAQNAGRNISSEARSAGYYGGDNKEFNTEIRDALGVDDNGKVIEGAERSFTAVRYDVNAGQLETADIGVPDGQELTESEKANLLKVIGLLSEGDISILGTISIVFIPGIKPHYGLGRAQVYLDRALLSDGETNALRVRLYHEVQERQRVIAKMDEYDKDWRQKRGDSAIEKAISKFAEDAHKELVAEEISDLLGLQAEEKQNIAKILTGQEMNIDLLHALREILISGKITKEKFVEAITNSAKEVVDLLNIIQDAVPEKDKDNVEEALSMYLSLVKLNKMGEKKTMPEFMNKLRSALEKTGKGAKIINDLINDLWNMEGYSVEDGKIVQSQYFALMLDGLRTFLEVKEGSDADKYLKILDEYKFRLAQVKNKFKLAETIFTDSGDEIFNALTGYLKLRQEEKLDLVAEVIARFMAYGENEGENEIISLMDDDSKKRYVKEGIQKLVSRKGLNSIGEEKPKDTLLDGLIEQGTARAKKGYEIAEGVLDKVIGESKWSSGLPLVIEDSLVGVGVKNLLQARAREGKLVIICKGEEKRAVINKWLSENEIGAAQFVDSYEETVGKAAVSMLTYETAEQNKDKINKHRVVRGTEKGEEDDLLLMSKIAGILGSVKELDKTVLEDPFRSLYTAYYHGAKSAEEIDELINKVMASIKDGAIFMELPPIAPFVKAYYNTLKTARELVATAA